MGQPLWLAWTRECARGDAHTERWVIRVQAALAQAHPRRSQRPCTKHDMVKWAHSTDSSATWEGHAESASWWGSCFHFCILFCCSVWEERLCLSTFSHCDNLHKERTFIKLAQTFSTRSLGSIFSWAGGNEYWVEKSCSNHLVIKKREGDSGPDMPFKDPYQWLPFSK